MKAIHDGTVTRVFKDPTNLWCVEVKRKRTGTKGKDTYINIMPKPRLKPGRTIKKGDYIGGKK